MPLCGIVLRERPDGSGQARAGVRSLDEFLDELHSGEEHALKRPRDVREESMLERVVF